MAKKCFECGKRKRFLSYNYAGFSGKGLPEGGSLPGDKKRDYLCVDCANKRETTCDKHGKVVGRIGGGFIPDCKECKELAVFASILGCLQTEFENYISSLEEDASQRSGGIQRTLIQGLGGITFIDFGSGQVRQMEQDAKAGKSIGSVFDSLVAEMIAIGRSAEFTVIKQNMTFAYNEKGRHKRVLEIGKILDAAGGMKLMQAAAYRVRFSGCDGRDLDRCWDGIGLWQQ